MKRFTRIHTAAIAGLAGFPAGWLASAWNSPPRHDEETTSPRSERKSLLDPQLADRRDSRGFALSLPVLSTVDDCRSFLDRSAAAGGGHPVMARFERFHALQRWLEIDAESALSEAERRLDAGFGWELFRAWLELHPDSALQAFAQASPALTAMLRDDFFQSLAGRDPAAVAAELIKPRWKSPTHPAHDPALRSAYQKWARIDPAAALAHAAANSPSGVVPPVLLFSVSGWAQTDPAAAWAYYESMRQDIDQRFPTAGPAFVSAIGVQALRAGPSGAAVMDRLWRIMDSGSDVSSEAGIHSGERGEIARALASSDPAAAIEWARTLRGDARFRADIFEHAAGAYATSDPAAALSLLLEAGGSRNSGQRAAVLTEAFAAMEATAPDSARGLLADLPPSDRPHALSGILSSANGDDPSAVTRQMREWLADPDLKAAAIDAWSASFSVRHGSGMRDPGPILAAVPELEQGVTENLLAAWVEASPDGAAGWIAAHAEDPGLWEKLGHQVLPEMAVTRPEFTADWIDSLPDSAVRTAAAATLAANWATFDPDATRRWIDSLPDSGLRKQAGKAAGFAE